MASEPNLIGRIARRPRAELVTRPWHVVLGTLTLAFCATGCGASRWSLWPAPPASPVRASVASDDFATPAQQYGGQQYGGQQYGRQQYGGYGQPYNAPMYGSPPNGTPAQRPPAYGAGGQDQSIGPESYAPPPGAGEFVTPASYGPQVAAPAEIEPGEFEPARILARVGNEVILAGDILGPINQALAPYEGKMPKDQIDRQRQLLMRQQIPIAVESKMLYLAYLRDIPADKLNEAMPKIWEQVHSKFDEDELPKLLEKYQVETSAQLDAKMREFGWSLAKQRRMYGERNLGMAGAFQKIDRNPEITHDEMLKAYEENAAKYAVLAQARWEQLMVRFDKFPSRQAAFDAISAMGNEVVLGGTPLWAVAKRSSHGFAAESGGQHNWTNQGSLASSVLDQAIFELPIGQLSQILEDEQGYHIVRVIERRGAGRTPFTEAQVEIKQKLQEEKRKAALQEHLNKLRREIPVWMVEESEPAPTAVGPAQ